jgi:hypothetical protein
MTQRTFCLCTLLASIAAAGCSKSNPAQPSSTGSGGGLSVSIVAPKLMSPANNAQVLNAAQPVSLVVRNAVTTGSVGLTYKFEVAFDSAFNSIAQTKDQIAQGASGQTGVTLDPLPAGKDYYWHARASGGGTTGVFGAAFKFTVGPAISVNPPTPVVPLNGASTVGWPALTVINAVRSGTVGPFVYQFDVATSNTFATIIVSKTVSETVGQTSFTPAPHAPPPAQALFWRATATDQSSGTSSTSAVQTFTPSNTQASDLASIEGVSLWSGVQPPGSPGHAALGDNWQVGNKVSINGTPFFSPPLEELQVFDLLDRGMDPESAISWMNRYGYSTVAAYYSNVQVIGFPFQYMALVHGRWDLVDKVE